MFLYFLFKFFGVFPLQQNLFQLNNYVKIGSVDVPLPNNTCRRHLPVSFVGYGAAGPMSRNKNG